MSEPLKFNPIPIKGRLVSGSHKDIRKTDHEGKPEQDLSKHQYEFGVAYPKAEFGQWMTETLWPYLSTNWAQNPDAIARLQAWWGQPGLAGKNGGCSLKIADGDKPNARTGKVNENTAGCFVVYFTSFGRGYDGQFAAEPPKCYAGPTPDALVQLDVSQVKLGDYVAAAGSMQVNGKTGDQLGAFMNCNMLWKLEDGPEIVVGVDPAGAFGGAGLTGSYNPAGDAGAAFGGAPQGNPPVSAPGLPQTGGVGTPAPGGVPGAAPGGTASPGNVPPGTQPHTDILGAGQQQPASGPTPGAAPGLPGM